MSSRVFPDELIDASPGEELDFFFDFVDELDGDTIGSGTAEVFDAEGKDVTQAIAPPGGAFGAWTASGTTFTVTFKIPKTEASESYLGIFTLANATTEEKYKKFLGIMVHTVAGVF